MKFFILGLLLTEPLTLYDLHRRFAAGLSHLYAASFGSIHRALRQLDDAGEIAVVAVSDTSRGKKCYRATAQGRRTWRNWMITPSSAEEIELAALSRVFLLGHLDKPEQQREVVLALYRRAVEEHDDLKRVEVPIHDQARYPRSVLEYGLRSGQGLVSWLEELLSEVAPRPADQATMESRP